MPSPCDINSARVRLNVLLREVVQATQRNCQHADVFQSVVPVDQITDYHQYVTPCNATICLEQILSRTRSCFYTSVAEFRHEYEQVLANALAYNSPGHGNHAYKPIISWAQDLLDICCKELHIRNNNLSVLEHLLKEALNVMDSNSKGASGSPKSRKSTDAGCPLSSMAALVAACELAAAQEGMEQDERSHYYEDVVAGDGNDNGLKAEDEQLLKLENGKGAAADRRQASPTPACLSHAASAPVSAKNCSAYDAAPKYRRHKSKVYIRPNKVVYLPTIFMEENFDSSSLPVNCEMIVETNGNVQPDRHMVTIKSVPRQGLSTMYCMTNVMKFQQQFLNWQILNWTKVDDKHIKIHLQGPNGSTKTDQEDDTAVTAAQSKAHESHKRKSSSGGLRGSRDALHDSQDDDDAAQQEKAVQPQPPPPPRLRTQQQAANLQHAASAPAGTGPWQKESQGRIATGCMSSGEMDTLLRCNAPSDVAAQAVGAGNGGPDTGIASGSSSPSHHDGSHHMPVPSSGSEGAQGGGFEEVAGGCAHLRVDRDMQQQKQQQQQQQQQQHSPTKSTDHSSPVMHSLTLSQQQIQMLQLQYQHALQTVHYSSQSCFPLALPVWNQPTTAVDRTTTSRLSGLDDNQHLKHFQSAAQALIALHPLPQHQPAVSPGCLLSSGLAPGLMFNGMAEGVAAQARLKRCRVDVAEGNEMPGRVPGFRVSAPEGATGMASTALVKRLTDSAGNLVPATANLQHALSM